MDRTIVSSISVHIPPRQSIRFPSNRYKLAICSQLAIRFCSKGNYLTAYLFRCSQVAEDFICHTSSFQTCWATTIETCLDQDFADFLFCDAVGDCSFDVHCEFVAPTKLMSFPRTPFMNHAEQLQQSSQEQHPPVYLNTVPNLAAQNNITNPPAPQTT